jgi:hypothetical protein
MASSRSILNQKETEIVRFTPFRCEELGLDGGGFDVEIDPKTYAVIDSYTSVL